MVNTGDKALDSRFRGNDGNPITRPVDLILYAIDTGTVTRSYPPLYNSGQEIH